MVFGTFGEKEKSGRPLAEEARNRFRGIVAVPEKVVDRSVFGRVDRENEIVLYLLGLSPGILDGAPFGFEALMLDEAIEEKFVFLGVLRSLALIDCDNLLDGPCGRPMILRDDNCEAVAFFAGDSNSSLRSGRRTKGVLLASTFR